MKAKRTAKNNYDGLFEMVNVVRASERAMAELCRLEYEDIYQCSGCGRAILDNKRSFIHDGKRYHNRDCADEASLTKEEI